MALQRVVIDHVRNLHDVSLELSPKLNILYGENASGKTSLLEAIHLLAYARSFRSHHLKNVISHDSDFLRVSGQLRQNHAASIPIGVEYRQGQLHMRVAGADIKKTSELAKFLPVIVLHQECQRFLSDGPRIRRKFIDWGVFHVEQDFLSTWRRFMRTLKQRNTLLQSGSGRASVRAWDREFVETAQALDMFRRRYCEELITVIEGYLEVLIPGQDVSFRYRPGWDERQELLDILDKAFEQDQRRGFTHYGPHRADLIVRASGVPAHEGISRGQQKLLICALLIAQARVHQQRNGKACVFLADDVKAELDQEHVKRIVGLLEGLDIQIIMTATERESLESHCHVDHKTFHVERGFVREVI